MKTRATAFRSNEKALSLREDAIHEFSRGFKDPGERKAAAEYMAQLIESYGPVVEGYPTWHPFTQPPEGEPSSGMSTETLPLGFVGLDHTIYLRDAFITAPYGHAEEVIKSTYHKKNGNFEAEEIVDVPLYFPGTTPVLVRCTGVPKESDGTIEKRYAIGSMLTSEVPAWSRSECGETWEDMRRYILGAPCGSRSSLFVNQETGRALREVYELLTSHGLFGPIRRE